MEKTRGMTSVLVLIWRALFVRSWLYGNSMHFQNSEFHLCKRFHFELEFSYVTYLLFILVCV